jgi:hypothetical protein
MSFILNWEKLTEESGNEFRNFLEEKLNQMRPDFLDTFIIPKFTFGTVAPDINIIDISNPLPTFYESDTIHRNKFDTQILMNISYSGNLSFALKTGLDINYPNSSFMMLPLEFNVSEVIFKGDLIIASNNNKVNICFKDIPEMDVKIGTELGYEHKLKNVSKVEKFVVDLLKRLVTENLVYPQFKSTNYSKATNDDLISCESTSEIKQD